MKNFRWTILLAACLCADSLSAQKNKSNDKAEEAVKAVINQFFEAMSKHDTTALRSACMPKPVFQSWIANKEGAFNLYTESFDDFVAFVGAATQDRYEERIKFDAVHTEQSLASVWTPYSFYLNDKLSHCGTNSFQLVKTEAGWKIQYILDTRRKTCKG